jgi:hypothetical protein
MKKHMQNFHKKLEYNIVDGNRLGHTWNNIKIDLNEEDGLDSCGGAS